MTGGEQTMISFERSEIPEDLLTLEDAARQAGKPGRHQSVGRKLERAWSEEKARNQPAEDFVARLCEVEPDEAERLLRQAKLRYRARRRRVPDSARRDEPLPSRAAELCGGRS